MEALSSMVSSAEEAGLIKGFQTPNQGPIVSYLLYADDTMFIGEWTKRNAENVNRLLRWFHLCSGLNINFNKSSLFGCNVNATEMASVFGCKSGKLLFSHLGIPVGANMNKINNWNGIMDIFEKRLANWRAHSLSISGRVVLIKAVLESLPVYYLSLLKVLSKVVESFERIMKSFLWGGTSESRKTHWVAWERVTMPKNKGGLGISRIKYVNNALLSKWGWRYKTGESGLWKRVIDSIHNHPKDREVVPVKNGISGVWANLAKTKNKLKWESGKLVDLMKGSVGDGRKLSFWLDNWVGPNSLKDCCPSLFKLEKYKRCKVNERFWRSGGEFGWTWCWKRRPKAGVELEEWEK
ncbi:uncharacterized protein LOC143580555 [Bidens hawaiensis]|uniref:uncharacterized protein LOC143580555 n=1 Tax=Bidens hawaiensis TaxID=980011 RepID=UPI0040491FED